MNTTLTTDQLMALMASSSFQNQLKQAGEKEAVQKILLKNGIDMTDEEVCLIMDYAEDRRNQIGKGMAANELDDEALDQVVGGISFSDVWSGISDVASQVGDTLTSDTAKKVYKTLLSFL